MSRPYNLNTQIRSALRKIWLWSPIRREVLTKARIARGLYQCSACPSIVGPKEIEVDHIKKVTPQGGIEKPEDWGIFIKNLLYCGVDGLVALCKECHRKKTAEERRESKRSKTLSKKTKKRTKRSKRR